jgi:hypothetical protein
MKFQLRIIQKVTGQRTKIAEFVFEAPKTYESLRRLVEVENTFNELTSLRIHIEEVEDGDKS